MSTIFRIAAKSTAVALLTTLMLVPFAGSAQAKPTDHRIDRLTTAEHALTVGHAALHPAKAESETGTLSHAYTRGDISCHTGPYYPHVKYKAWGGDMPRYTTIEVRMSVYINGEWWLTRKVYPRTSGSGNWSTNTYENSTLIRGEYKLVVLADSPTAWGTGSDICNL
ncbi:MAG: hypothetical protein ACRDT4_02290 [Micromonosporaceae bacterium]